MDIEFKILKTPNTLHLRYTNEISKPNKVGIYHDNN